MKEETDEMKEETNEMKEEILECHIAISEVHMTQLLFWKNPILVKWIHKAAFGQQSWTKMNKVEF